MKWHNILSYYKIDETKREYKELLEEHIHNALKRIEMVNESRLGRFVHDKMTVDDFHQLLSYAIIFHDAGKAFFQSEKYLIKNSKSVYLSFYGHEFISALLADLFVTEKMKNLLGDESYLAVVFAVMYHHHAMNPRARARAINRLPSVHNALYLNKLKDVLSIFLKKDDQNILEKSLKMLPPRLNRNGIETLHYKLIKKLVLSPSNINLKKLSFILLDALIVCDYLAAQEREGEGGSTFTKTIKQFYKSWLQTNFNTKRTNTR
ncbi:MAG: CRISPR-associated endonuclease Cas3'' [Aigarchaeota archaeon]|nr:CRISPR-associated endonuclease Cas3'' [Candidatus Pelearchaeum maunauluense]